MEPSCQDAAGEKSLDEFNKLVSRQQEIQDLRDYGLTSKEVEVKLQQVCYMLWTSLNEWPAFHDSLVGRALDSVTQLLSY